MQFESTKYEVSESDGEVAAYISRSGDLGHKASVRCYTRQHSARVDLDYVERTNTDDSRVTFHPGMLS